MAAKARLVPIQWDSNQRTANPVPNREPVVVHFNPESLKLQYANENRGGRQPGGSGQQNVGSVTSKLSVELLFDTTDTGNDVRRITKEVAAFVSPMPEANSGGGGNNNRIPPGISFEWGTIIFRGVVSSMDETLDYFSEEGVPLRATVSLVIDRQSLEYLFGPSPENPATRAAGRPPGTTPLQTPNPGDNLQSLAGRAGRSSDWKAIAAANNVDDPLRLTASAQLNMNVSAGFSAGAAAGGSAGFSAGGSVGFSAGGSAGANAAAGFGASGSAGMDFSGAAGFGAGASAGFGASGSAGLGAGASAEANASLGIFPDIE